MTIQKLKPVKAGMIIRDPSSMIPLKDTGTAVSMNTYWRRRIADGDAVIVKKDKSTGTSTNNPKVKEEN